MLDTNANFAMFDWLYSHIGLIGYPALCVFVWKASQYFTEVRARAITTCEQVETLATDYFPAIKGSLSKQDDLLHSIDQSMKVVAERASFAPIVVTASKARTKAKAAGRRDSDAT